MTDKEVNQYIKEVWSKFTELTDKRIDEQMKRIKKSLEKKPKE